MNNMLEEARQKLLLQISRTLTIVAIAQVTIIVILALHIWRD